MFKTLFAKMLTIYLALILALLTLLGVTIASIFKAQYVHERENELIREADELCAVVVSRYLDPEKRPVAAEQLANSARKYDALIQLLFIDKTYGKASFFDESSRKKWEECDEADISREAEEIMVRGGIETINNMFAGTADFRTMTVKHSMVDSWGNTIGAFFIHVDMSDVYESLKQVYMDVIMSALIAVLFATLFVSYITGKMSKPITDMNNTVNLFTKGNFDVRANVSGNDEVAQLARSFNVMAGEITNLEKARRSFVANVSHELRSPLTSMRGFLEAMQDGTIPPEEFPKYFEIVLNENKRMTAMVNDLLDLARIESSQNDVKKTAFDINSLIMNTLITFEAKINAKNIDVEIKLCDSAPLVYADQNQITQVLHNLCDNAIKFLNENGRLTVSTVAERECVRVTVADNGTGISEEDLPYIFDRFYKAEKAHTPSGTSGTGLGLSIVKRIIESHGETIDVSSELGKGTSFTFTVMRAPDKAKAVKPRG